MSNLRSKGLFLCFALSCGMAICPAGFAQIKPDATLGAESSTIRQGNIKGLPSDVIEGGAVRGANLFHSFSDFNIREGRGAYFANPALIQNILSRVTGGNPSNILGTLGVLGNANLFLINPSGIIFGPNARLDVRGAFTASTADSLLFKNGFEFSASNPQAPPLLTVDIPLGLRFRGKAGDINSSGNLAVPGDLTLKAENLNLSGTLQSGGNLTLDALNTVTIRDSLTVPFVAAARESLLIQGNQSLDIFALNHPESGLFSGGDMILRSGNQVSGDAHFWSGGSFRIEKLDGNLGGLFSISDPVIRTVGDVSIAYYQGTSLHILAGGKIEIPNYIWITGADPNYGLVETVTLSNGQQIAINGKQEPTVDLRAGMLPGEVGSLSLSGSSTGFGRPSSFPNTASSADINIGTIFFRDSSSNHIEGKVLLTNQYKPNPQLQGNIQVSPTLNLPSLGLAGVTIDTNTATRGGTIAIDSRGSLTVLGKIDATSQGVGGDVTLNSAGDVSLRNGAEVNVRGGGGGNITINAQNVEILGGSNLNAGIGDGLGSLNAQAGNIEIQAKGKLRLEAAENSSSSLIANQVGEQFGSKALGNAGEIIINTGSLEGSGNFVIGSVTAGQGNAGKVTITAKNNVTLTGGFGSGIASAVAPFAIGKGADVIINTPSLSLSHFAQIATSTLGQGNAGNIRINASKSITLDQGSDLQASVGAELGFVGTGKGGDITITARSLSLSNGAKITTQTAGKASETTRANAGKINITTIAGDVTLKGGAQLRSDTSGEGDAGDITINAGGAVIFDGVELINKQLSRSAAISEVGIGGKGKGGDISVTAASVALTNGADLSSATYGMGDAGSISVQAQKLITLEGSKTINSITFTPFISTTVNPGVVGKGGDIDLKVTNGSLTMADGARIATATAGKASETTRANAGKINITTIAGNVTLKGGAQLRSDTFGEGDAGDITINAGGAITFDGVKLINNESTRSAAISQVGIGGKGKGGDFTITAGSLSLTNGASLSSSTGGQGNAGNVIVRTDQAVSLSDGAAIFSTIESGGKGDGGNIEIHAGSVSLANGAGLNTFVRSSSLLPDGQKLPSGEGNAGNILLKVTGDVTLNGFQELAGQRSLTMINSSVGTDALGQGGDISITARSLSLKDGAELITGTGGKAGTYGRANAGNIQVTVTKDVNLSGGAQLLSDTLGQGDAGNISLDASGKVTFDSSLVITAVGGFIDPLQGLVVGTGKGGDITIKAESLTLTNGAVLTSETLGQGNAGDVTVDVLKGVFISGAGAGISSQVGAIQNSNGEIIKATGNGGNVSIKAESLTLKDRGVIASGTSGQGNAGNVSIQADDFVMLSNLGNIRGNVEIGGVGNGGDIDVQARSLTLTTGSQIGTTVFRSVDNRPGGKGKAGKIKITAADSINISGVSQTEGDSSGLFASTEKGAEGPAGSITVTTKDFRLSNGAVVNTLTANSGDAGNITINANTFEATEGGQVISATRSSGNAGNITLNVTENLTLAGSDPTFAARLAQFGEDVVNNQGAESGLFAQTQGQGNARNIIINTPIFNIADSAIVSARTSNAGNGGSIIINAPNSATVGNNSQLTVETSGAGKAGDITLTTDTLNIGKDAELSATATQTATNPQGGGSITLNTSNLNISGKLGIFAETQGQSPAGNLTLQPNNNNPNLNIRFTDNGFISASTTATGNGGNIAISAPQTVDIRGQGKIAVETSGSGNAGTIGITTQNLTLADGLEISASTTGKGEAGQITIAAETLDMTGGARIQTNTSSQGKAGDITLNLRDNLNLSGASIEAITTPNSTGDGGNIFIDPSTVTLTDGSKIAVNSQGQGNGGNIFLQTGNLSLNNSQIAATTASGEGGNITLTIADFLRLRNDSAITATAGGTGNGGNLTIGSNFVILYDNGKITANAFQGKGGNIDITTQGLFLSRNSQISASSELGIDGVVEINTLLNDPSRGLVDLPETIVDPNDLINRNSCKKSSRSEFIITGRGGLPANPEQAQNSDEVEVGLVAPAQGEAATIAPSSPLPRGKKIVPAQGWIRNDKGEVVLVGYAANAKPSQRQGVNLNPCNTPPALSHSP